MTERDTLLEKPVRREDNGPPCRRCTSRVWNIQERRKAKPRWLLELVFAAPDVWIFQNESGGWPGKTYERWTCANCGRSVRL